MRLFCVPKGSVQSPPADALWIALYGQPSHPAQGSAGEAIYRAIRAARLRPSPRAWDFLSIAMAVVAADLAGHRDESPDGWTRDFQVTVGVSDPNFWAEHRQQLQDALAFLTTDRWRLDFVDAGFNPVPTRPALPPAETSVVLLSGGLDSLAGAIDLAASGLRPLIVSHRVRGDLRNQRAFARAIAGNLRQVLLAHNARVPRPEDVPSQRSRSLAFIAYAVLVATSVRAYRDGTRVPIYLCENGFIAINPPLTAARLGSLSTRTVHPLFLQQVQTLLDAAELSVQLINPYRLKTKGEMLADCADQKLLHELASASTSCGRFARYNYRHCGRCVPCQIRRASFLRWGVEDSTTYVFKNLGVDDEHHAGYDDVRAVAMALALVRAEVAGRWLRSSLPPALLAHEPRYEKLLGRGLAELGALHQRHGVK